MMDKLRQYAHLMRLHKPIGILLLMWPTAWALWIAGEGYPNPLVVFVFAGGVVLMRSAGCVINDFADRDIDPHVTRTRDRPIAAGKVTPKEALVLCAVLCLAAFSLVLLMNSLTVWLSLAGGFIGATLGMLLFRHKIRKPVFWIVEGVSAVIWVFIFMRFIN